MRGRHGETGASRLHGTCDDSHLAGLLDGTRRRRRSRRAPDPAMEVLREIHRAVYADMGAKVLMSDSEWEDHARRVKAEESAGKGRARLAKREYLARRAELVRTKGGTTAP